MRRDETRGIFTCLSVLCISMLVYACASQTKLQKIRQSNETVEILPVRDESDSTDLEEALSEAVSVVDSLPDDGPIIMNSVFDPETGEMTAIEELRAARIVSRRYQVAERDGKVDLPFEIHVPKSLQDSKWQLRLVPDLTLSGEGFRDTTLLEPVYITGEKYRERQLKGYEQYERFLYRLNLDSNRIVYRHQLEQFLKRNLPALYYYKSDSTYVSDEDFYSRYDVSAEEAVDHYTRGWMVNKTRRLASERDERFRSYVKSPIVNEGIRVDTIMQDAQGDYVYRYVQTIETRKDLKYAYIAMEGSIWDQDETLYIMPRTDSIEYPISSLSHFVKDITRYKTKTVWRHQEANSSYDIVFNIARSDIQRELGNNASELDKIKSRLRELLADQEFDLDSIIVMASCSPEGRVQYNSRLSRDRTDNVCAYFRNFMKEYTDSLDAERGFAVNESGEIVANGHTVSVPFISSYTSENWELLDRLVRQDENLGKEDREAYFRIAAAYSDPDRREHAMRRESWFPYVKDNLYPKLRVVNFHFNLHRKGMVEEQVQTEEVDTLYARGVQCLRDRDYDGALEILKDYGDYNTAVAFMAKDRNLSAFQCLEKEEETADVCYLKAILSSRFGNDDEACGYYRRACDMDRSYIFRGNLDPEITVIIKKYGLNKEFE